MSETDVVELTGALLRECPLPEPDAQGGKDQRGSIVVIGGAASTPGAALLAGTAALRVGAGRLTIATCDATAAALAVAMPEAGVEALPTTPAGGLGGAAANAAVDLVDDAEAVLVGPGLRGPHDVARLLEGLLPALDGEQAVVLDALALTCGVLDESVGHQLAGRLILTPNLAEARRLLGDDDLAVGPDPALALASTYNAAVMLGAVVAAPDGRVWCRAQQTPGLGTGGSGDVLAGTVAGLAARGASPAQAALWGLHLHGSSGERLARRIGRVGFLARELLDEMPAVLASLSPDSHAS